MRLERGSPASLGDGDRASGFINAPTIDGPRTTPPRFKIQDLPPSDFDPVAMPIIARHWFGVSTKAQSKSGIRWETDKFRRTSVVVQSDPDKQAAA